MSEEVLNKIDSYLNKNTIIEEEDDGTQLNEQKIFMDITSKLLNFISGLNPRYFSPESAKELDGILNTIENNFKGDGSADHMAGTPEDDKSNRSKMVMLAKRYKRTSKGKILANKMKGVEGVE